jgi:topoisomerase-4 subunit A
VACFSANGRLLLAALDEVKVLSAGGRGVILMELEPKETLMQAVAVGAPGLMISGTGVVAARCRRRSWPARR